MVDISHREKIVRAKIIYYGPAAGGKTTNLIVLHRRAHPKRRGEMVSVNSTQDRTILLDLLPVKTPAFRGYDLRFQVIAVPGQPMYAASRKILLHGADALVFVANSAADRWQETLSSLREMNQNLLSHGLDPASLPVVFQYNKRDLPEVTPLEAMDRTLNARHTDGVAAVAIRDEGVIETFGAILARTMADLSKRYKIGEELQGARSIKEWTAESLKVIFDWKPPATKEAPTDEPDESPPRVAVKVPVARAAAPTGTSAPSAATPSSDPEAEKALVDSYAKAAVGLTNELEDLRESLEEVRRCLDELSTPIDAAEELLSGSPAAPVLKTVIERIGQGLGASMGSLSLIRPDGKLESVALWQLDFEPLLKCKNEVGAPLAPALMEEGDPVIFSSGDSSPTAQALDLTGGNFSAMVAVPVKTHARSLGILCFYLKEGTPAPNPNTVPHLARLGQSLALALEVASGAIARERLDRMERATIMGQLAEQALMEIGTPIDQLFMALGRVRRKPDSPSWLLSELLGIGAELARTKELRDGVLAFMAGRVPNHGPCAIEDLLDRIKTDLTEPLGRAGIQLEVKRKPEARTVRADGFLLRCALLALVDHSRTHLAGHPGGVIRISADTANGASAITVADNYVEVSGKSEPGRLADYLAWSLDRKAKGARLGMVQTVVEHYKGQWQTAMTDRGNETRLVFPTGEPSGIDTSG
jgi:signal recognition particle receptor subunit beta